MVTLVRWVWPQGVVAATVVTADGAFTHSIDDSALTAFAVAAGKTTWDETDIEPYLASLA